MGEAVGNSRISELPLAWPVTLFFIHLFGCTGSSLLRMAPSRRSEQGPLLVAMQGPSAWRPPPCRARVLGVAFGVAAASLQSPSQGVAGVAAASLQSPGPRAWPFSAWRPLPAEPGS